MSDRYITSTRKLRLDVRMLEVGMFVTELDRPWSETPFLLQGFFVENPQDIEAVRSHCDYVYIDPVKGRNRSSRKREQKRKKTLERPPVSVSFEEEIEPARSAYRQTHSLIKSTLDDIRFGRSINVKQVKNAVENCVESVLNNPSALMLLTQLQNRDEYTSQHSFDVCVLSIAFGRFLGMPRESLVELGICALLHDVGKMRVPIEILNKAGDLNDDEFDQIKLHTVHGRDILISAREIPSSAVDVAHAHHEHVDGSGYPRGLKSEQLTLFTRIISIADVYNAVTSERVYHDRQSHMEAVNILTKGRETQFEASLVMRFISCIGIYPPGTLVELNSGEVAVVTEVSAETKAKPKLIVVLDRFKQPVEEKEVDLAKEEKTVDGEVYKIKITLSHNAYGLCLNDFLERGLVKVSA